MSKVKVCHITSVHPPKDGRIFYKECTSLAKGGYDVSLVVAGASDEVCNGVKIIGVPVKKKGRLHRMINVGRDVYKKALETDAEIYHFHDPELLPYGLKLKRKGKKVIFDSHEFVGAQILTKTYIPKLIRKFISNIYLLIESYICRRLDTVVEVCTIDGRDYFANRCKKSCFITNASIIKNINLQDVDGSHDLKKIVHIGSLTYIRGISFLADAMKYVDGTLVLAGTFESEEFEKDIKNTCGEKLIYTGVLPLEEIQPLLSKCGIGICTVLARGQYNHCDTLATKMYDYMLAGIPMVMSNVPYLVKFNQTYHVGLCVSPDNPKEIADAINYLISHPDEAIQMGENGRRAVLEEFNWATQEKKLLELYASLSDN